MLCAIGNNTKERVLDQFQVNQLVGPQRVDGSFFVLKIDEFDRENKRLGDEVLAQHNISNLFWTREGNTARFSDTFAQLVDTVDSRQGVTTVPPWVNIATESEVVADPILRRLNRAFLGIKATIFENARQLMDKAREIGQQSPQSDLRFAIIGQKGASRLKSANIVLENLAVAKAMSLSKTPKEVRLATGWEKGADGLWRYEIQDVSFQDSLQQEIGNKGSYDRYTYIDEVVSAPELLSAYPAIGDIGLHIIIDPSVEPSGRYEPGEDRSAQDLFDLQPSIAVKARNIEEAQSILIHEVQHAIQYKENFALGGTPGQFWSQEGEQGIFGREKDAEAVIEETDNILKTKGVLTDLQQLKRDKAQRDLAEIDTKLKEIQDTTYSRYRRLSGEVEARNAQTRATMTAAEKKEMLLAETEDVARADQEVLLGALGASDLREQVKVGQPLFHMGDGGEILGFAHGGKIYLNGEKITANTTLEEAGHIWLNWAKETRPDLFIAGIEKVKNSPYLTSVTANSNYTKEALRHGPKGSSAYNLYLEEEALAKAIADEGAKFVSEAKRNSFREWVMGMWKEVAKAFGIKTLSSDQIKSLTLSEFAKKVAADMFSRGNADTQITETQERVPNYTTLTDNTRLIKDELTDEIIGTKPVIQYTMEFPDGARSMGVIEGNTARIRSIDAPKIGNGIEPVRGTKTYERVLEQLQQKGITTINVRVQSVDSTVALKKLVEKGILSNPRDMVGVSTDRHPTTFDITDASTQTENLVVSPGLPTIAIPENWENPC